MWIIKIGGSWIKNPALPKLISLFIKNFIKKNYNCPWWGCFSDAVRDVFKKNIMDEKTAHFLAMRATGNVLSIWLKKLESNLFLSKSKISELRTENKIKIWMPSIIIKNESSFLKNWESTSDSVAAWLHKKINSDGLIFIKSVSIEDKSLLELNGSAK